MEYNKIVAVTGMPGLYEAVSSKTDGALVRSLEDKSTKFVSSRVHNLSHLESIEVYTVNDNVQLADVFAAMKNSSEKLPDSKDNKAVTEYFKKAFPDLDFERVYVSDMKKMVKWFEIIQSNDIDFSIKEADEDQSESTVEEVTNSEQAAEKPARSKAKKEAAAEKPIEDDKPKRVRKKKTDEAKSE